jgi:hypothetical protein
VSLWRLEWLRLHRTHRLTGLVAVFLLFGFTGPLATRYLEQLLERFGGGVEVRLPVPVPADGMAAYVDNGQQLGLLVVVLVAAAALAFDAQRESAAFLRTRVRGMWQLVLPKVAVNAGAAVAPHRRRDSASIHPIVGSLSRPGPAGLARGGGPAGPAARPGRTAPARCHDAAGQRACGVAGRAARVRLAGPTRRGRAATGGERTGRRSSRASGAPSSRSGVSVEMGYRGNSIAP